MCSCDTTTSVLQLQSKSGNGHWTTHVVGTANIPPLCNHLTDSSYWEFFWFCLSAGTQVGEDPPVVWCKYLLKWEPICSGLLWSPAKALSSRTSSACMIWQKLDLLIGICTFCNLYNHQAGTWNARGWLGQHLKKHKRWQKIIVGGRIYHHSREKLLPSWSKLSSDIAPYLHLKFYKMLASGLLILFKSTELDDTCLNFFPI